MKSRQSLPILFCFISSLAVGQEVKPLSVAGAQFQIVSLTDYITQVRANSGAIKVRQLAADSAVAMEPLLSSPNVSPSFSYSKGAYYGKTPYTPFVSPQSDTYSLSGTLEGFGKRESRKNSANAEIARTKAEVEAVTRAVEGDALFAYIDTLRLKLNWQAVQRAIGRLSSSADREAAAAIVEQNKIAEAISNDIKYFAYGMTVYLGRDTSVLPEPIGNLTYAPQNFDLNALTSKALTSRRDVLATEAYLKSAQASVDVAKKNRNIDFSVSAWYSVTPAYTASGTSYTETTSHGYSISVPIPTANLFNGPVVQASNYQTIAEIELRDLKQKVVVEINQAHLQYVTARRRLEEAEKAHRTAAASLDSSAVKITAARETEFDLNDARTNHAKALIALRRISGDYDLP